MEITKLQMAHRKIDQRLEDLEFVSAAYLMPKPAKPSAQQTIRELVTRCRWVIRK